MRVRPRCGRWDGPSTRRTLVDLAAAGRTAARGTTRTTTCRRHPHVTLSSRPGASNHAHVTHPHAPGQRTARRVPGHRPGCASTTSKRPSIERLATLTLFASCTHRQLTRIDGLSTRVSTDPGRVLIREGATAKEFYVIIDGQATVSVDGRDAPHPGLRAVLRRHRAPRTGCATRDRHRGDADEAPRLRFHRLHASLLDVAPQIAVALLRNHVGHLRAAQAFAVELEVVEHQSPTRFATPSRRDQRPAAPLGLVMSV